MQANTDIFGDYTWMSRTPHITWEIVEYNPERLWCYNELSSNPNITWETVQANPKKWNYEILSYNKFEKHPVIVRRHNKINARYYLVDYPVMKYLIDDLVQSSLIGGVGAGGA